MTYRAQPGIAIGPILMAIALIAVIVGALSVGSGGLGSSAIIMDRTVADLRSQIDLLRTKIDECAMLTRQPASPQFMYPGADAIGITTPIANVTCPRDPAGRQNIWTGARPTILPQPPKGFEGWQFVNHGDPDLVSPGGICIRIQPDSRTRDDAVIQAAIQRVLKNYATSEYNFDAATQRIIIWIRRPASGSTC